MGCNCNKGAAAPKFTWTSSDGNQVVRNLTEVQAKTRQNNKGGSIAPQ